MNQTIWIDGMSCQHCSKAVETALRALDGVSAVSVDLAGKKAELSLSSAVSNELLRHSVEEAGYSVSGIE